MTPAERTFERMAEVLWDAALIALAVVLVAICVVAIYEGGKWLARR